MILQVFGAFLAVYTISVLFEVPRKFLFLCGLVAAVSWMVFLICTDQGMSEGMSTLAASMFGNFLSHCLARLKKAPTTMFLIPAVLPLVPGVNTYRLAYYLILQDEKAAIYLNRTLTVVGMIVIGIIIVDTIFRVYGTLVAGEKKKE